MKTLNITIPSDLVKDLETIMDRTVSLPMQ